MSPDFAEDLAQFIATRIMKQPVQALPRTEPLVSTGLIDSFHLVELALYIEEQYGVRIEDSELSSDTFDTVDQLAALVARRSSGR